MLHLARNLRSNQTDAERLLWQHLRNRQFRSQKFRRQQIIGPYVVDFVCLEARLIVEIDGGQHAARWTEDAARTGFLEQQSFRVMRFWNNEVLTNIEGVLYAIEYACSSPSPPPSPARGEGASVALHVAPSPLPSPARREGASCCASRIPSPLS